jgi:hypothetical protein
MSWHPVTPMAEADRRATSRYRARCADRRGHFPGRTTTLEAAIASALADEPDAVLFDAAQQDDLARIGVIWRPHCASPARARGDSVAQALLRTGARGELPAADAAAPIARAEGLRSCRGKSPVTAPGQAARRRARSRRAVSVRGHRRRRDRPATGAAGAGATCADALKRGHVSAHGACAASGPRRRTPGAAAASRACSTSPPRAARRRARRLELRCAALGAWALGYAGTLAPGVALTRVHADTRACTGWS